LFIYLLQSHLHAMRHRLGFTSDEPHKRPSGQALK
jgi:hypothetical protein